MRNAEPVPLRPVSLLALCEAARGLPDATVARLIDRWYPEALALPWEDGVDEPMIRRAVAIPRTRPRPALREELP